MMKAKGPFLLVLAALLCLPAAASAVDEGDGAMIHKPFTLLPGKEGEPFTLYYPIELTGPGEISFSAGVEKLDPDPPSTGFQPLRAVIVDARAFTKMKPGEWKEFCLDFKKYNPMEWMGAGDVVRDFVKGVKYILGDEEKPPDWFHGSIKLGREGSFETVRHAVDSPEFEKTAGRYVIIFRNMAALKASGGVLIRYPGNVWDFDPAVERYAKVHPDLAVEDASLDGEGRLEVRVANRGRGAVNLGHWHLADADAVTLVARVDGRDHVVPLRVLDPGRKLRRGGGSVTYVIDSARIPKAGAVTVTIDPSDRMLEESEGNNRLEKQVGGLQPGGIGIVGGVKAVTPVKAKPDLEVMAVRLDGKKAVEVEVRNNGGAVDPSFWAGGNASYLNLKMNGNGWANIPLGALDPGRKLARPGGTAVHSTGLVLKRQAEIAAAIDSTGTIDEADEGNNTMKVLLRP